MYRHLLIATDLLPTSVPALRDGLLFAQSQEASVALRADELTLTSAPLVTTDWGAYVVRASGSGHRRDVRTA